MQREFYVRGNLADYIDSQVWIEECLKLFSDLWSTMVDLCSSRLRRYAAVLRKEEQTLQQIEVSHVIFVYFLWTFYKPHIGPLNPWRRWAC